MSWFHGGVRDLKPGDMLLPPSETGNATLQQYADRLDGGEVMRRDRVYLTRDPDAAATYAMVLPYGDVYEAEPQGAVEPDPDCRVPGYGIQCERAVVTRVVRRRVPLPIPRPKRRRRA